MYTTTKKINKLSNIIIISWIIIAISVLRLPFKDYHDFESFQAFGQFLDIILMIGVSTFLLISTERNIKRIKGIEFDLTDEEFLYKTCEIELKFNKNNPAKYIRKNYKNIEILTFDDKLLILKLEDFLIDYKELKSIESRINSINKQF